MHPISQQLRQLDQLRNTQQLFSFRSFQIKSQVAAQRIGRGECFAEVDQQVFGVDAIGHGEQPDGGVGGGFYCGPVADESAIGFRSPVKL